MLRAIEQGFVQREIQNAAYDYQMRVEAKDQIVVGVNEFTTTEPLDVEVAKADAALEARQVEKLRRLRETRDGARVKASLDRLREAARGTENLMPIILEAVKAYATVGEICNTLREEWGEYRPKGEF